MLDAQAQLLSMLLHELELYLHQRVTQGHGHANQTYSKACFSTAASSLLLAVLASQHSICCP